MGDDVDSNNETKINLKKVLNDSIKPFGGKGGGKKTNATGFIKELGDVTAEQVLQSLTDTAVDLLKKT